MGHYQNTKPHHPKPSQRPLNIITLGQNTWEKLYIILKPLDIFFHILAYGLRMLASGPSTFYLAKAQAH
jgi:hypothetical protein